MADGSEEEIIIIEDSDAQDGAVSSGESQTQEDNSSAKKKKLILMLLESRQFFMISEEKSRMKLLERFVMLKLEGKWPERYSKNITSKIALEIVETEEIINYENTTKTIIELKELGYKIYIDDFGSGYSNFIYLAKIKADAIKIDGSIISTINSDKLSYLVAKNIVNFAKEAQIEVIAEHVSTKEIYDTVKALGINKFQGFYFSKPIT